MSDRPDRSDNVLDTLARYAPSTTSVSLEWNVASRDDALADIIGDGALATVSGERREVSDIPLRFVPARSASRRSRWGTRLPLAASVAVLVVAVGAIVAVVQSRSGTDAPTGSGPAFDPPNGLSGTALGTHQYSYRVMRQIDLDANGNPKTHDPDALLDRSWIAPNGDILSIRTGSQNACHTFGHSGSGDFEEPTASFFDLLPTDVDALNTYLRLHVSGSSSLNEAVFVAVGDALRTANGLASPKLRAAMVGVLSRTPGVTVHQGVRDYLGRTAVRADFVDQRIRAGEVQSLYFDSASFQLLEEHDGHNSEPGTYSGPSPAYSASAVPSGDDPQELTGPAYIDVMISEKVVDSLPPIPSNCSKN